MENDPSKLTFFKLNFKYLVTGKCLRVLLSVGLTGNNRLFSLSDKNLSVYKNVEAEKGLKVKIVFFVASKRPDFLSK